MTDEYELLKQRTDYLSNFKQDIDQRIENMLNELDMRENTFKETERNLLHQVESLTKENQELTEKNHTLLKRESIQTKEIDHLSKKVRDFDLVLEENANE